MRYFMNPETGMPHGYDETDARDDASIAEVIAAGWKEVTLSFPPSPTDADKWAEYQAKAKAALEETSPSVERIIEAVVLGKTALNASDVVAFMEYRAALRAILSEAQPATIPTDLPAKPAYPTNT